MKHSPWIRARILFLAILAVLFLQFACRGGGGGGGSEARPALSRGDTAPPFALRDVSGNVVDSAAFAGRPVVINFFATWCPPCREEIPGFVDVYRKYKPEGFELVGISMDTETGEVLPEFIMEHRIDYPILLGDLDTARAYGGVSSIPTTIFIGRDGRIRNVHVGYLDRETFDREVRNIL